MRRPRLLALVLLTAAIAGTSAPAGAATRSFAGTYASESWTWDAPRGCASTSAFRGDEPASGGGHPVFLYLPGSGEPYNGLLGMVFTGAMANRGFVAASVQYADWEFYAEGIEGNARCVFDRGSRAGALAQLCRRPGADCSKGVVVAGFSQGASIAARARNVDAGVRAAYLLGFNELRSALWEGTSRWRMATAPPLGTRALPNDRVRIVDGRDDAPEDRRDELNDITGRACAVTALSCLTDRGAGWYVVRDDQVLDGWADHCYFEGGNTWCPSTPSIDFRWLLSDEPWALGPNLSWLASFTG